MWCIIDWEVKQMIFYFCTNGLQKLVGIRRAPYIHGRSNESIKILRGPSQPKILAMSMLTFTKLCGGG